MTRIAYRTRIWTLLLLTLLLAGTTAAQNTTNGLPQCAVSANTPVWSTCLDTDDYRLIA